MLQTLHLLQNTPDLLFAERAPDAPFSVRFLLLCIALWFFLPAVFRRQWRLAGVIGLVALFLCGFTLTLRPEKDPLYRLTIDKYSHEITVSKIGDDGRLLSEEKLHGRDETSAEIQLDRSRSRLVLLRRDGYPNFPLDYVRGQHDPDLYVILNALRENAVVR